VSATPPLELLPLGTAGYIPTLGRQTMCFLVKAPGKALLLDAGSGVARLGESPARELLADVGRVDLLLTHYHLDHVIGISYLPALLAGRDLRIFAPTSPLTTAGTEALDRLISPPLFPLAFHRWPIPVEIVPYGGPQLEIDDLKVRVRGQKHPGGSVGVRIGDALAYVTDSILDLQTIDFVHGVRNLLHEVWLDDEEASRTDVNASGHSSATPVAELARQARVGRLLPVHHHPRRTAAELESMVEKMRQVARCPVEVPVEGRVIGLG